MTQPNPRPLSSAPESDTSPDDEVVLRVLQGDRERYGLLVGRYQEALFRFALGMVGNSDAAADIVQDSFVKAFNSLAHCRDPSRFGAWIHRIVRNRCLDHLKRRKFQALEWSWFESMEPPEAADERVQRREIRQALFAALQDLPAPQREAFLLKHLEDRPYEEIAEEVGASISALKMRVKRAREALYEVLSRSKHL